MNEPLLKVTDLQKYFPVRSGFWGRRRQFVRAVDRVSFDIFPGETVGLVGESGCGKTTVGRSILRLIEPSGGSVVFQGQDLMQLSIEQMRKIRTKLQIVFQDPYSSLNPRMVVLDLIGEGLVEHKLVKDQVAKVDRVVELLEQVGLSSQQLYRYPHEFSGGQRQRIAIARAIALHPALLVCDEAVSALDVSVQAQIINLLIELRQNLKMAYLFISHDLAVVKHISQRIAVMYLGQIVEYAPSGELFDHPGHPYTEALLSAIPAPNPDLRKKRIILQGEISNTRNSGPACCFAPRCPKAMDRCKREEPPAVAVTPGHYVKCFLAATELSDQPN
ncbi:MAG TPA: ABC transporter ATP-binding protein [Bacillota bacterium]|nr:ABC transporter ATP-binding protein [Bacillota bacterium]